MKDHIIMGNNFTHCKLSESESNEDDDDEDTELEEFEDIK